LYQAKFTDDAIENIRGLKKGVRNSLRKAIEEKVLRDPGGCSEELSGPLAGFRSFHFGDYRLVYRVYADLQTIAVVGVGLKSGDLASDIYKRLERLAYSGKLADRFLARVRLFSGQ
jgi:mRNA-degrading endonuclease RelE of RelBE toxin-antitoxin system